MTGAEGGRRGAYSLEDRGISGRGQALYVCPFERGLFGVGDEEDLVDHGDEVGDAGVLEAAGDGFGDEVGVGGGAADDDTEGDDGEGLVFGGGEGLDNDGDLEGAGDADDPEFQVRREFGEGGRGGLDESVGEAGVVAARDDGDAAVAGGRSGGIRGGLGHGTRKLGAGSGLGKRHWSPEDRSSGGSGGKAGGG